VIESISKCISKTPKEVKALVEKLWRDGFSISEIENRLLFNARMQGKKLVFINSSKQGIN